VSTLISVVIDGGLGLNGYLAIDSTVNGRSYGGIRIAPDVSSDLITQLARTMTLKYGFVGLPAGGAKAGIVADPEMPIDKKRELLKNFGQAIRPFLQTKSYFPGSDLMVDDDDIRFMLTSVGLKVQPRSLAWKLSGFHTGITVFATAVRAVQHIGLDLNRVSVAIEGFGNVGASAAQAFWERGFRLVAISTSQGAIYNKKGLDIGKLVKLRDQVGSKAVKFYKEADQIEKKELLELEVDLLCPCANSYSINADNAGRVAARVISPGANIPTTTEAEQILFQSGILSIPDFMANCGGVLGASMWRTGLKDGFIRHFLEYKVGEQVTEVIEAAEKENIPCGVYAQRIAEDRFLRAKAAAEKRNITSGAFSFALGLYRRGIIPYQLVTPFAPRYFKNRFR
jgi:glutamate dehydrogenase (NAD(P)+)